MKYIFSGFLLFWISFLSCSESHAFFLRDTTYTDVYNNSSWELNGFYTFHHNEMGLLDTNTRIASKNDSLTPIRRDYFSYDEYNRVSVQTHEIWDTRFTYPITWTKQHRYVFEYSGDGYTKTKQSWELILSYEWVDKHKMVYKTDQNGNIISTHSMGWSQEKEEWNSVYRDSVIFDEYENVDSTYLYIWNDEKEEWIDYQVYFHENTYENGHLTERIVNLATDTGGRPVSKSYFTYYQDSLASEEHYQFSGEYKKARKTTYEYDEHMNLITETTYLPNSEDEWEPKERFRHIYSSVTSVAQQPAETARARIYPNPASDALKYEIAAGEFGEYAIKDIAGRTVARGPIATPQGEIDIRGLAPGVYFIRFISDINIYNLKFVKSE